MARKLVVRGGKNPHLENLSPDAAGVEFGQPLTNQGVPTGYVVLDNPARQPPVDRKRIMRPRAKSFGFSERPKNFNDLDVGEAGAGASQFRRGQFFSRVLGAGDENSDRFEYNHPIGIATARSADTRPRFWHISFFAVSRVSPAADGPLTQAEIMSPAGQQPTNTVLKGRVQVFDESGSRFFDVNIHGTSSFSFYGWGVTTFILLPTLDGVVQGFEVDPVNATSQLTFPTGQAENTFATGRIIPTFQNVSQITDQATRTVSVPAGAAGTGIMPVPPGARAVRIRANIGVAAVSAAYEINFASIPATGRPPSLGRISLLPGRLETQLVAVPNAPFIAFDAGVGDPAVGWIATFVVEA